MKEVFYQHLSADHIGVISWGEGQYTWAIHEVIGQVRGDCIYQKLKVQAETLDDAIADMRSAWRNRV